MQTKKGSLTESFINTGVGLITTLVFTPLIFWIVGIKTSYVNMTESTILFTMLSILRNYTIRRWFNKKTQ